MTHSRQVPISEAMTLALEHHQAGRLDVAEAVYRAVLDSEPGHAGARHGLALLALQAGRPAEALPALAEAIEREPGNAAHWSNYAVALAGGGEPVAARDVLQKALAMGLGGATIEKALAQVRRMIDAPPPRVIETFPGDEAPATGR
jgi:predicted Zn-dependent protease